MIVCLDSYKQKTGSKTNVNQKTKKASTKECDSGKVVVAPRKKSSAVARAIQLANESSW